MKYALGFWLGLAIILAGWSIGHGFQKGRSQDRFVTVKGLAEQAVVANQGTWVLRYQVLADSLEEATARHQKVSKTVWEFAVGLGFSEEELQKGSPKVQEVSHYPQQRQLRYQINDELRIITNDVQALHDLAGRSGELLQRGVALAGWEEPQYHFTQLGDIKPQMIEQATQDARAAARKFADDVDAKLGSIRRASQGYFSFHGENQGLPESSQIRKVARVVVTIDYLLED